MGWNTILKSRKLRNHGIYDTRTSESSQAAGFPAQRTTWTHLQCTVSNSSARCTHRTCAMSPGHSCLAPPSSCVLSATRLGSGRGSEEEQEVGRGREREGKGEGGRKEKEGEGEERAAVHGSHGEPGAALVSTQFLSLSTSQSVGSVGIAMDTKSQASQRTMGRRRAIVGHSVRTQLGEPCAGRWLWRTGWERGTVCPRLTSTLRQRRCILGTWHSRQSTTWWLSLAKGGTPVCKTILGVHWCSFPSLVHNVLCAWRTLTFIFIL
ncbi:hypothetical protein DFH09DRAFT_1290939 [Mycena vulgaris]|nr:hypothetical protein DFH09DRAFT_1290939 [Mycena vulgaris]